MCLYPSPCRWLHQVVSESSQSEARQRAQQSTLVSRRRLQGGLCLQRFLSLWSLFPQSLPQLQSRAMQIPHKDVVWQLPTGSRRGSLHHCQDARGCESQAPMLDNLIRQALRVRAALELCEGEVSLQEV